MRSSIEFTELLCQAITKFGPEKQLAQCMEECAELITAIIKYSRYLSTKKELDRDPEIVTKLIDNIKEERIDVSIMMQQLDLMFSVTAEEFTVIHNKKLDKLQTYLD